MGTRTVRNRISAWPFGRRFFLSCGHFDGLLKLERYGTFLNRIDMGRFLVGFLGLQVSLRGCCVDASCWVLVGLR